MPPARRQFLATSGAAIFAASLPSSASAASAASSRLYLSRLPIQDIARGLALGVGRAVWRHVQGLEPRQIQRFIEQFDARRLRARLET